LSPAHIIEKFDLPVNLFRHNKQLITTMDKLNNSQLLMCEKEDLIKYIEELKDYKDAADALENQLIEDLGVSEEACKYPLDPYEAILFHVQGNHQDYGRLNDEVEELKKENEKLKDEIEELKIIAG
jgi:vacuolar-type H+-ATPase subunit I/STV1